MIFSYILLRKLVLLLLYNRIRELLFQLQRINQTRFEEDGEPRGDLQELWLGTVEEGELQGLD